MTDDTPIPITLVMNPIPPPFCIHEHVSIRTFEKVAIVACLTCPYQALAVVEEL